VTVDEAILQEAAFQLLASSSVRRYIREALRLAVVGGVVSTLHNPVERERAQLRLEELLSGIDKSEQRTPAEFEAAILLCALARTEKDGGARALRLAKTSTSSWVRNLAFRLLALGPADDKDLAEIDQRLSNIPTGHIENRDRAWQDTKDPALFPRAA